MSDESLKPRRNSGFFLVWRLWISHKGPCNPGATGPPELELPPMPLTDTTIRKAKPTDKAQRLPDGGGLYLELSPAGGTWWRLKYRFDGKDKRISLAPTPRPASPARAPSATKPASCWRQALTPASNASRQRSRTLNAARTASPPSPMNCCCNAQRSWRPAP